MRRVLLSTPSVLGIFALGLLIGFGVSNMGSGVTDTALGGDASHYVYDSGYPKEQLCENVGDKAAQPPVVLVMGTGRTGSTLIYNMLRLGMIMKDPNTLAGYYSDLIAGIKRFATVDVASPMEAMLRMKVPLVIKAHLLPDINDLSEGAALPLAEMKVAKTFISYRDLRQQVLSQKRMAWSSLLTEQDLEEPDFCTVRKTPRRLLTDEDWHDPKTWVLQARANVKCHQVIESWAKGGNVVWVRYEDLPKSFDTPQATKWLEGYVNQLPQYSVVETGTSLVPSLAAAIRALHPLHCGSAVAVNPATHYHRGHVRVSNDLTDSEIEGMNAITEDELCRAWLQDKKYKV